MNIQEELHKIRPTLSAGSLKTYTSLLKNVHKNVFKTKEISKSDFDKCDEILNYLKDLKPNQRKTILSGLVVISDKPKYRSAMLEDIKSYSHEINKQEKSVAQEANWVDQTELNEVFANAKSTAIALYKKSKLTMSDLQDIQNYIILCLMSGIFISPRRNLDYTEFKIKNIDKEKDNYLDKNELVFNTYKTSKFYNTQKIEIPKELKSILTKWIKLNNDTDYLLFDINGSKLTSVKLTQRLNKIFGKHAGANLLRHLYLTEKFGDTIKKNNEIDDTMEEMGSSASQLKTYVKHD
jgi:hypothetical protein